ncbi:potassium/sodium hyperpolarization-activated cyclic nucleotide-gated channel 2-like [Photinus pyralis]|uniref:potassium/sodium hyperpolarization-activated cyclic nucleotide-gated channel 2-like n=1 Tax=Photinus pyralis TaxID=7054 RepID=UPI00126749AB|nr:potassium/sodium hyperpolarization-activated cyclic nucleotide-gated channel 2-like [Photinus pyralis]
MSTRVSTNYHKCGLTETLDSGLPKLRPGSSLFTKWKRVLLKQLVISAKHPDCKFYFKSNAMILSETRRQMRYPPYTIHPFSKVALYREVIMSIIWFFDFYFSPLFSAFNKEPLNFFYNFWHTLDLVCQVFLMLNVVMCFFIGVMEEQTKKVELEWKKIAKKYLSTFFIFDCVGSLPFAAAMIMFRNREKKYPVICITSYFIHMVRFIRLKSAIQYFQRITSKLGITFLMHEFICLALKSLFVVHWCACYVYLIPKVIFHYVNYEFDKSWWIYRNNISIHSKTLDAPSAYSKSLRAAFCHVYGISLEGVVENEPLDHIIFSLTMVIGFFLVAFITARIFLIVKTSYASETEYEDLLHQFLEYGNRKKMPVKMKNRMIQCLEHNYQKRYFHEKIILNTLSGHLKAELFLHDCKRLVEKVKMFQAFSKSTVGLLISHFKREVFLKNDIVFKHGQPYDAVRFILYGTIAFILADGSEASHMQDGFALGLLGLVLHNEHYIATVITLEICEMYKIDWVDLEYCIQKDEEIYHVLHALAEEHLAVVANFLKTKKKENVTEQLCKGKVLEHELYTRR